MRDNDQATPNALPSRYSPSLDACATMHLHYHALTALPHQDHCFRGHGRVSTTTLTATTITTLVHPVNGGHGGPYHRASLTVTGHPRRVAPSPPPLPRKGVDSLAVQDTRSRSGADCRGHFHLFHSDAVGDSLGYCRAWRGH